MPGREKQPDFRINKQYSTLYWIWKVAIRSRIRIFGKYLQNLEYFLYYLAGLQCSAFSFAVEIVARVSASWVNTAASTSMSSDERFLDMDMAVAVTAAASSSGHSIKFTPEQCMQKGAGMFITCGVFDRFCKSEIPHLQNKLFIEIAKWLSGFLLALNGKKWYDKTVEHF